MVFAEGHTGGDPSRERKLVDAKQVAQEAGFELRFHTSDGPDEYQVIDREHGTLVGVYWKSSVSMWGTVVEGKEMLFGDIYDALGHVKASLHEDEEEPELQH